MVKRSTINMNILSIFDYMFINHIKQGDSYGPQGTSFATTTDPWNKYLDANGYPNNASIDLLVQSSEGFTPSAAGNRMTKTGGTTANCWVQYNQATIAGGIVTAPTISYQSGVMNVANEANINSTLRTQC